MDDLVHEPAAPAEESSTAPKLGRRGFLRLSSLSATAAALAACSAPPQAAAPTATAAPAAAATTAPPTTAPSAAPAAAPAAATFVSDLLPYPRVKVATLDDLSSGVANAAYPDQGSLIYLLKLGKKEVGGIGPDEDIVAYSGLCSHMGCPLVYDAERKILQCPCHFSHFDATADAMLINGPSCQNLPRITLELDGQDIYAVGVQGLLYGRANNMALV
ncbi:MAG: arsenate reductase (azurin) small subunit [Chloroflexales bacterium]|nr:arsenate reductase (azurin) small subunit [Chloroflexales bacterium]